jgi:single-strand DNA-binding protein
MAEGFNKVYLLGNVGGEPRLKDTQGGKALFLRIATTKRNYDRESGNVRETTEWHDCAVWGKRAEKLADVLKKGQQLFIEGELRYRQRDINGTKVTVCTIAIKELRFGAGGGGGRSRGQADEGW